MSKTKKAYEVRNYFIQVEKLVDKYKNYIIEGLKDKVQQLENNQKPKINPTKGIVYIIQAADGVGFYKIGKTANKKARLQNYNTDKANDISFLYEYEADDIHEVEKCIKKYGKKYQYRKHKEIYKVNINTLKDLIADCDKFENKMTIKYKNKPRGGMPNIYIALCKNV